MHFCHSAAFCQTNSVCPSVCFFMTSQCNAKTVRDRRPMVTMGSLQEVTIGLLRGPISNPLQPTLPKHFGLITPSQNLHCKLWPVGARYSGGLYWQPMGTHQLLLNTYCIVIAIVVRTVIFFSQPIIHCLRVIVCFVTKIKLCFYLLIVDTQLIS